MKIFNELITKLSDILKLIVDIREENAEKNNLILGQIVQLDKRIENSEINIQKKIELENQNIVERCKCENEDMHERLVHIEDKINDLLINQSNKIKNDSDFKNEIKQLSSANQIESVDVHERLVHIEDKINLIMNQEDNYEVSIDKKETCRPKKVIHFIRNIDWKNAGDMACNPLAFFPEFTKAGVCIFHTMREIRWELVKPDDWVILGGGGIFECIDEFQSAINRLLECNKHVIAWACGHNTHYFRKMNQQINYSLFFRCTVRDFGLEGEEYLPDVSCMSSLFEQKYENKRNVGVLEHLEYPITEFEYDRLSNTYAMDSIIKFIGESSVIITNTWHGCYWALLMGKKVILYHPFSNKFFHFKYKPIIYSGDLTMDIEQAVSYPDALVECRKMNISFYEEIEKYINKDIDK